MENKSLDILKTARKLSLERGISNITINDICIAHNITKEELSDYFVDEAVLVDHILKFERENFKSIFDTYSFKDLNAIDSLLFVSKETCKRFQDITPTTTFGLKKTYPEAYQNHFDERISFIFDKIKINIQRGIDEGLYRMDLSGELISRLYISRLIDIHNPDFGNSVTIKNDETPVFWGCGVTPQLAIMNANLEIVITHSPGHMFIADIKDTDLRS